MSNFDVAAHLRLYADLTEKALERYLSPDRIGCGVLQDAMRYAVLGGGKRVRAYLVCKTAEMFGASAEAAMPFAAAIEMIHAYSLIHDDLPCMDNDDMRRGKPSCHKAFGETVALLAGDALLSEAFAVSASNDKVAPISAARVAAAYGTLSGVVGMAGGQMTDLTGEADSFEALSLMFEKKTGGLIYASVYAGYMAATDSPDDRVIELLKKYAYSLALAFQIRDDILDVTATEAELGKPVGSDSKNDKHTSLAYMSIEEASALVVKVTEEGNSAICDIPDSESLTELALYLCGRSY